MSKPTLPTDLWIVVYEHDGKRTYEAFETEREAIELDTYNVEACGIHFRRVAAKGARMSAARVRELRACNNPVFNELLDAMQEMSDEYQKWICELEGPTPEELQTRIAELEATLTLANDTIKDLGRDLIAADAKRHLYELDGYDYRVPGAVSVGGTVCCSACGISEEHGCPGPSRRWQNKLVCEVVKLQGALKIALVELENVAGWSGSSGNWPLHDAVTKARAALAEKKR